MQRLSLLLLALWLLVPGSAGSAEPEPLAVIVARGQQAKGLDMVELSLIYWRKKLYWPDGKRMLPVNLPADTSYRRQFSQLILGSLPEVQTDYWNDLYFHGTSPPHVVGSQEAMLRFVAETPGAIGYVSACKLDARVKAVLWLRTDGSVSGVPPIIDCN